MDQSEQLNELAGALAKAQGAIAPASKDKVNPAFRSKYADLSSVWEACRKALTDNGLSVIQLPVNHEPGYAALRTMLLHTSGQFISTTVSARLVKDDAQGLGSALTYLRRYSLAALVGVVADEDDDGNAASNRPQNGTSARQEPQQRQQTTRGDGGIVARKGDGVRAAHKAALARGATVEPLPDGIDTFDASGLADWLAYYQTAGKEAA